MGGSIEMSQMSNSYAINEQKSNDYCRVKMGDNGEKYGKYDVNTRLKEPLCQIYAWNRMEM